MRPTSPASNSDGRPRGPRKGGILHHGAIVSLIRFTGLASVFFLQVVLARLLADTTEYGEYAWGQSILFLAGSLAALGIPLATNRFIASLSAQSKESLTRPVRRHAQKLILGSASALIGLSIFLSLFWQGDEDSVRNVLLLALFLAPSVSFFLLYQGLAVARRWPVLAFLPPQVLRPLVTLALAALVWWLAPDKLNSFTVLLLVGTSITLVTTLQAVIYHLRERQLQCTGSSDESSGDYRPETLLSTALPMLVSRAAMLVMEHSSTLLLGILAGPAATGLFFAADRLARLAAIPLTINSAVAQPRFAAAYANSNLSLLQRTATQAAHLALWPTLLITGILAGFSEQILGIFGEEFRGAALVLVILLAANVTNVMTGAVTDLLFMSGKQVVASRVMSIAAVVHLGALVILVPEYGATGAALTAVVSAVVSRVGLLIIVRRELGIKPTVLSSLQGN